MKGFLNALFFMGLLAAVAGTGIFIGYSAINNKNTEVAQIESDMAHANKAQTPDIAVDSVETVEAQTPAGEEAELLYSDAVLKFEYYNGNGGLEAVKEQKAPYFLAGKSEEDLKRAFSGWEITAYGPGGAVLKKEADRPAGQNYLVSVQDGYVAVYYDETTDSSKLKEITDTPVSSLPEDEARRLEAGILVEGENSLIRILEDLSS